MAFFKALTTVTSLGLLEIFQLLKPAVRHLVELLGWEISPSQGLYLQRTELHRKTRIFANVSTGIATHDYSVRAVKTNTLDHTPTTKLY
jgi:hypothetical protein